jgi:hypothetical protein
MYVNEYSLAFGGLLELQRLGKPYIPIARDDISLHRK